MVFVQNLHLNESTFPDNYDVKFERFESDWAEDDYLLFKIAGVLCLSISSIAGCICFRKKVKESRLNISSPQIALEVIPSGDNNDNNEESQHIYEEIIGNNDAHHDIDNDSLPPQYDQIFDEGIYDVPKQHCRHCT